MAVGDECQNCQRVCLFFKKRDRDGGVCLCVGVQAEADSVSREHHARTGPLLILCCVRSEE